jgi:hypothetical protein
LLPRKVERGVFNALANNFRFAVRLFLLFCTRYWMSSSERLSAIEIVFREADPPKCWY